MIFFNIVIYIQHKKDNSYIIIWKWSTLKILIEIIAIIHIYKIIIIIIIIIIIKNSTST